MISCCIADLEQQKAEKEKATKELETENANLGSNIEHLHALHIKQQQDTERFAFILQGQICLFFTLSHHVLNSAMVSGNCVSKILPVYF